MALTAGDLTNLRDTQHKSTLYMAVSKPAILLDAQINGSFTRGARSINYDSGVGNGYADVLAGMTVEITTTYGIEKVRLKAITGNNTSGTLTLAENGITFPDNGRVIIRRKIELHAIPPTIRNDIVYVDYDVAYADQNSYPPPVCRVEWWVRANWVPYSFGIYRSSSHAMTPGASISSITVSAYPSTGITITPAGIVNFNIDVTTAGEYLLKITATDTNGKTQTTYRLVFGFDATDNPPYSGFDLTPIDGSWDNKGRRFTITPNGNENIDLATIPEDTLVALWYDNTFNNAAGFVDLWGTYNQNIVCAGYLHKRNTNTDLQNNITSISFEVVTPEALLAEITELGSISIQATTSTPNTWYYYEEWLSVGRAIHYLLKWHTTALEAFEISGLTHNTLGLESAEFSEPNVLDQITKLAWERGHKAKLVSNRWGGLVFSSDAQFLHTAAERAALDVIMTITEADIDGPIDIVWQAERAVASAEVNGFYYDGVNQSVAFISVMPAYQAGGATFLLPSFRGEATAHLPSQVIGGQIPCDRLVGRVYAYENRNPLEIRFKTPRNYLGAFDIVPNFWYRWGIADESLYYPALLNSPQVNLIRNPRVAYDTVGHANANSAPTWERVTTFGLYENTSLHIITSAGLSRGSRCKATDTLSDLAAATTYTFISWVWIQSFTSGTPQISAQGTAVTSIVNVNGDKTKIQQWQQIALQFTTVADLTAKTFALYEFLNNGVCEVYIGATLLYPGTDGTVPYFDGDFHNYQWFSSPHASITERMVHLELYNKLMLCRSVTIVQDNDKGAAYCEVILEPEVTGEAGVPGNYPTSYPIPATPAAFDPGYFMLAYVNGAAADAATVIAGLLAGTTFSNGSAVQLDANDTVYLTADNFDNDSAVVFWLRADHSMHVAHVGRATLVLSAGATANLATTGYATVKGISVATLSTTRALLVYTTAAGAGVRACTADLSGTSLTLNTESADISTASPRYAEVTRLSSSKGLMICVESPGSASSPVKVNVLNVDTAGIVTPVSAVTITTGTSTKYIRNIFLVSLTANKVAVVLYYVGTGTVSIAEVMILDIDGSDIVTFGSIYTIETDTDAAEGRTGFKGGYKIDDSTFAVVWRDTGDIVKVAICEVSGTVITHGAVLALTGTLASANIWPAIIYDPDLAKVIASYSNGTNIIQVESGGVSGAVVSSDSNNTTVAGDGSLETNALISFSKVL